MSLRLPKLRPTQAIARPGELIIPNRPLGGAPPPVSGLEVIPGTTQATGNQLSHPIDLPPDIQAGDLLVLFCSIDGVSAVTVDQVTAGPWTLFDVFLGDGNTNDTYSCNIQIADGSEGGLTLLNTTANNEITAQIVYGIRGSTGVIQKGALLTGPSANAAALPTVTASWGSAQNMFLVPIAVNTGGALPFIFPAGYDDNQTQEGINFGGTTASMAVATRLLEAAADSPADYGWSGDAGSWISNTYVVEPGSPVAVQLLTNNPAQSGALTVSGVSDQAAAPATTYIPFAGTNDGTWIALTTNFDGAGAVAGLMQEAEAGSSTPENIDTFLDGVDGLYPSYRITVRAEMLGTQVSDDVSFNCGLVAYNNPGPGSVDLLGTAAQFGDNTAADYFYPTICTHQNQVGINEYSRDITAAEAPSLATYSDWSQALHKQGLEMIWSNRTGVASADGINIRIYEIRVELIE